MQVITENGKFIDILSSIQNNNPTSVATLLPDYERVFEVDLSTRTIQSPDEIVTVQTDHDAETLYFKVGRYFDNIDLTTTVCVIQYINANKEQYVYAVPYYDIDTFSCYDRKKKIDQPMIIFPWLISGTAADAVGTVQFSIRFFKLDDSGERYTYNLSTLPSSLEVVQGLKVDNSEIVSDVDFNYYSSEWESILSEMHKVADTGGKIYWVNLNN